MNESIEIKYIITTNENNIEQTVIENIINSY